MGTFTEAQMEAIVAKAVTAALAEKATVQSGSKSPCMNFKATFDQSKNEFVIRVPYDLKKHKVRTVLTGTKKSKLLCRTGSERKASPLGWSFDDNGMLVVHTEKSSEAKGWFSLDFAENVEA